MRWGRDRDRRRSRVVAAWFAGRRLRPQSASRLPLRSRTHRAEPVALIDHGIGPAKILPDSAVRRCPPMDASGVIFREWQAAVT